MHLLLTDRLTCPRCGPEFGLILMASEVSDRRVWSGHLGCFNCREEYPVEEGVADLRPPPRAAAEGAGPAEPPQDDPEAALRLAALLGVQEGPGYLFVMGTQAEQSERLAAMIEGIEVIAVTPSLEALGPLEGVSCLRVGDRLPFQSHSMRGVALEGEEARSYLEEGIRILSPGSRLVLAGDGVALGEDLEARGMEVLLATERVLVAQR